MEGRIGRSTYLGYSIGIAFIEILLLAYIGYQERPDLLFTDNRTEDFLLAFYIITGFAILALLYLSVLRLHDINLSGGYALLGLIPIINIAGIALFLIPGTKGANKYGADPKSLKKSQTQQRQTKRNPIDQEILYLKKVISTIETHIKLLDNSLSSGLITQNEFNDKVGKLTVNREKIESRLEEINVTKLEKELIWNQLDELKVLRNKRILNQKEYNEKVKSLFKRLKEMRNVKKEPFLKNDFVGTLFFSLFVILVVVLLFYLFMHWFNIEV